MNQNSGLNQNKVLEALRSVQDPDLHKDIVTLGMVRDLEVQSDTQVSLRVVLTTPACPMKAKIEADVRAALATVGVTEAKITMDAEVRDQRARPQNSIKGITHIIAVSSGKGGVGKSTISVNLATALARAGARVGLMDTDIYGPNIPTMMGVTERPKVTKEGEREMLVPPISHGVKVMSMGFLIQPDQPLVWRGPMLHNVLTQFCRDVSWGELDYLIVDMPPGTGDVQLSLAQLISITGAVLVSTPQEVAMQDVRKAFFMWEKVKVPILGVVENMSYFECDHGTRYPIFGSGGGELLARKFNTELLAQIPIVPAVREGGDAGRPVVVADPESPVARALTDLASKTAQKVSILASSRVQPSQIMQIGRFN